MSMEDVGLVHVNTALSFFLSDVMYHAPAGTSAQQFKDHFENVPSSSLTHTFTHERHYMTATRL